MPELTREQVEAVGSRIRDEITFKHEINYMLETDAALRSRLAELERVKTTWAALFEVQEQELAWTTKKPTAVGGYWVRRTIGGDTYEEVMNLNERGAIGPHQKPLHECIGWEFAGPISMPKERTPKLRTGILR